MTLPILNVLGCSISATAGLPGTVDVAGFDALTWTSADSCQIVTVGSFDNKWATKTDNTLCPTGAPPRKQKLVFGEFAMRYKYLKTEDATLTGILQTAFESATDVISFAIVHPDGADKVYFTTQVLKFDHAYGGAEDDIEKDLILQPQILPVYKEA